MEKVLRVGKKEWVWGEKTFIMGILNATPDSFSDGGRFIDVGAALEHSKKMVCDGADIIDIGGESTRPGSVQVSAEEEIYRIIPVIHALSAEIDIPISVDTYKAKTAEMAIKAGAHMINDIWGLKYDPEMADVVAQYQVPICIMHNKSEIHYNNLVEDVISEIEDSIEIGIKAGVKDENIIIDPGIGFGKTWEHNLQILRYLDRFKTLGYPILLGASRKSFIGKILDLDVDERLEGTIATTVIGTMKGVDIVRVHDVLQNKRAASMTDRVIR